MAEAVLAVPFGVPVGEEEDGVAGVIRAETRGDRLATGEQLGVDGVVFRPGGCDGAGEGKNIFAIEAVIRGRRGGVPIHAGFDGSTGVVADEGGRIGVIGGAADVFEAPVEGLDAAIVVGGPAAVLVAADFAFEPMHEKSQQFTVYSQKQEKKKSDRSRNGSRRISTQRTQRNTEKRALGMRHGRRGHGLRRWGECGRLGRAAAEWPGKPWSSSLSSSFYLGLLWEAS